MFSGIPGIFDIAFTGIYYIFRDTYYCWTLQIKVHNNVNVQIIFKIINGLQLNRKLKLPQT